MANEKIIRVVRLLILELPIDGELVSKVLVEA